MTKCAFKGCSVDAESMAETCEAHECYYYCETCKAVTPHSATMCCYSTCDMERCDVCEEEKHMYGLRRTT